MNLGRSCLALISAGLVGALAGCFVESSSGVDYGSGSGSAPSAPPPSSTATEGSHIVLAEVDTDKTLNVDAGQGVGVFVEYSAGGHWHIFWTCDTALTGETCPYNLNIATGGVSPGGSIGRVVSESLPSSDYFATSGAIRVTTRGDGAVQGLTFDTSPGDTVSVDATLSGSRTPIYFFFVQGGVVNGGYAGKLPNPMHFVGSTP